MLQIVYDQSVISLVIHLTNYQSTNMIFYKHILSQIIQVQMDLFGKIPFHKSTKFKVNYFGKIHSHKID